MNGKQQQELKQELGRMDRGEVRKLYKQAAGIKKHIRVSGQIKPISLDEVVLEILRNDTPKRRLTEIEKGLVIWIGPKTCSVRLESGIREVQLDGNRVAVGDSVSVGLAQDGKTWMVGSIDPRRTRLSRPDVGNSNMERVIVANVDTVVIVVSVGSPPLHPRLIDRYLIAIQRGEAEPLICLNKIDLLSSPEELKALDPYKSLNLPVVECSVASQRGIEELRGRLLGKRCAFVGHSGVGKSSLVNALYPELRQQVGEVSEGYGRGTHTTTSSSLFDVGGGTELIDTPGIRSLGLWKMEPSELKWFFPEFDELRCKFRDCCHDSEPGCAVKSGVEDGLVHPARYDTYLRILKGV